MNKELLKEPEHFDKYFLEDTDLPINSHLISYGDDIYHDHCFYEIVYMQSGSVSHFVNEEQLDLSYCDILFLRPKDAHLYKQNNSAYTHRDIIIETSFFESICNFLNKDILSIYHAPKIPIKLKLSPSFMDKLETDITAIFDLPPENGPQKITLSKMFLIDLITFFYKNINTKKTDSKYPVLVNQLIETLNISSCFTKGIHHVLSLFPYDNSYLCRLFKKHTGTTMTDYLNNVRLNYVANQLKISKKTVLDISHEVGFSSVSHLNNLFKAKYNMPPLKYRQNVQKNTNQKRK